jgi:hypothetical protein
MEQLVCKWCAKSKNLTDFSVSKVTKSGYVQPCKACAALEIRIKRLMARLPKFVSLHIEKSPDAQQCLECQHTKHVDAFPKERRRHNGKSQICKDCTREGYAVLMQRTHEVPESKICCGCGELKLITEYGIQTKTRDGRATQCNTCMTDVWAASRIQRADQRKIEWAQWYESHQPEILEYRRTHATEIAARGKKWREDFPEKNAAREQRRRARKENLPDTWTHDELDFMLAYWKHACAVCGNPKGLFWSLAHDHWIPLSSDTCPGTVATNMIPLCHGTGGCNNSKNATEAHAWLLRRYSSAKAAKIEKAIAEYFAIVAATFPTEEDAAAS